MLVDLLWLLHLYKLLGVVLIGILIRAVAAQGQFLVVYVAGSHLERHKADTADIVFRPGVGVFFRQGNGLTGLVAGGILCREVIPLHIAGRNAHVAQHQHRCRGVMDAVAVSAALQRILQEVAAAVHGPGSLIVGHGFP